MNDGYVLGVDVGGTEMKAELLDRRLRTRLAGTAPTPPEGGSSAVTAISVLGADLLSGLPHEERGLVRAVGLAVPGVLELDTGTVVLSANIGWRNTHVTTPVEESLGLPVVLSHDVAAAGLAELSRGAGRGVQDLVVVVIGTGVAATVVVDGRVVRGKLGRAGELGHVVVRPGGPACGCGGRGCLETVASAGAIARAYSRASGRTVTGALQVRNLLGQDPVADAVWAEAVDALADGLTTVCALLSPARIVVGGGLSAAGETLLTPLRSRMVDKATVTTVPEVVTAELGGRAGVIGAAMAAWQRLDNAPQAAT